jgi:hypothetical protein
MRLRAGSFAFLLTLVACAVAHAQAPKLINFQGKLANIDGTPVNGSVPIIFTIHTTPTGDNPVWSETHDPVNVTKGLFSVLLGGTLPITPAILDNAECWLEMKVGVEIMSPRQRLVSVAFAQVAAKAETTAETLQDVVEKGSTVTLTVPGGAGPTIGAAVTITNDASTDYSVALHAIVTDPEAQTAAIYAENTGVGGIGLSAEGAFMGVYGAATADDGGRGVYGQADGTNGQGVCGQANGTDGRGVYGVAMGPTSYGVYSEGRLHSTDAISGEGDLSINGDTVLGDNTVDTIAFVGQVSTDIDPDVSGLDLGDAALRWSLFADEIDVSSTTLVANLNSDTVDGFDASDVPAADTLLALNADSKLPADITGDADTVDGKHVADLDADYVNSIGDTMTGTLILSPAAGEAVDITAGGIRFPDATVQTTAAVNQPPVALLKTTRRSNYFVYPVVYWLDAGESYDPEGTATLQYSWDFVGQGEFGDPDVASLTSQAFTAGTHLPGVRVSDGSRIAESKVLVRVALNLCVLDDVGNVGEYTSLCVVASRPAISYRDGTNNDLKYVRAANAQGSSWGTPVSVDTAGGAGYFTSLCVVDGRPAISYYAGGNGDLNYVRAADAQGFSWGTPVAVDTAGEVGGYTSLCVVDGRPAISYLDAGENYDLKYVRAADAQGSSWGTPVAIDTAGGVGLHTSLCVVDGRPAISYNDATNGNLKYVRAADAQGSSWDTPVAVDTADNVGEYTSLCVVDGWPAISYYDQWNGHLKYVRAADAAGSSWGTPVAVDTAGYVGQHTSLCVVDGWPAISYYDVINDDLKYVRAADAQGSSWGTPLALDTAGYVGLYTSLCVVDGRPAISYWDWSNSNLKYMISP